MTQQETKASIAFAIQELGSFETLLNKRFSTQLPHAIFYNEPHGITSFEHLPKETVLVAIRAAIGEYLDWDTERVKDFAGRLLEEGNIHDLAAVVFKAAA